MAELKKLNATQLGMMAKIMATMGGNHMERGPRRCKAGTKTEPKICKNCNKSEYHKDEDCWELETKL